jgi:hypothetical protein
LCLLPASCLWLGQCIDNCIERLHFGMRLSCLELCFLLNAPCVRCGRIGEGDLCTRVYFHQGGILHSPLSLLEGGGSVIPGCLIADLGACKFSCFILGRVCA